VIRVMTISLVLMLAAETYCTYRPSTSVMLANLLVVSTSKTESSADIILSVPIVYKLVRFYQPSSREEYATTRATLTIFSESTTDIVVVVSPPGLI
jgi:hypothetical protein